MRPEPTFPPQGALRQPDGSVLWRVWAPKADRLTLVTWPGGMRREAAMVAEGEGYFLHRATNVAEGLHYAYKLPHGHDRPDPASRWQPDGVHRPSAVFFPDTFAWTDHDWHGLDRDELAFYELHVGTFSPEGTFDAVIGRLPSLHELGVTALQLMPVAQFPGGRNWGYDGVHLYAAQNTYGGPRGLQRLVDAAHRAGLAVFLDVVYNHLGPEGNYLGEFGPYYNPRYPTPWGQAVNYDGRDCEPVRRFVIDNALMWVRDFHLDGLRLDAVHAIFDLGARHLLAELADEVHREGGRLGRRVQVIAESALNDVRLTEPADRGGYGLDGVWSDDFHHAVHALLTGERDGYYEDFGETDDLVKVFNEGFVYDGRYSPFRRRRHGSRADAVDRAAFVVCVQNHDQVGNRALGDRFGTLLPPEAQRLAAALMLLSPFTPLLFMGEEYGETRPFPFFCSFEDSRLIDAVRRGRREEFARFRWRGELPDPQAPATFESAKLSWRWPAGSAQEGLRRLYEDLLTARHRWPALRDRTHTLARSPDGVLLLERGTATEGVLACANLTADHRPLPELLYAGREVLSTAAARYAGPRPPEERVEQLYPFELVVFGPVQ